MSLLLCGCGAAQSAGECKKVETLLLHLSPSVQLNQGEDGESRSVSVSVYQLADSTSFDAASYAALWFAGDKAALGDALLSGPDETRLVPGQPTTLKLRRHPDARLLGLAAKFRRRDARWKVSAELPPARNPCDEDDAKRPPSALYGSAVDFSVTLAAQPGGR